MGTRDDEYDYLFKGNFIRIHANDSVLVTFFRGQRKELRK